MIKSTITRALGEVPGNSQSLNQKQSSVSVEREANQNAKEDEEEEVVKSDEIEYERVKGIGQEDGRQNEERDVKDKTSKGSGSGKEKQVERERSEEDERGSKQRPDAGGDEEEIGFEFPFGETVNITAMLEDLKEKESSSFLSSIRWINANNVSE